MQRYSNATENGRDYSNYKYSNPTQQNYNTPSNYNSAHNNHSQDYSNNYSNDPQAEENALYEEKYRLAKRKLKESQEEFEKVKLLLVKANKEVIKLQQRNIMFESRINEQEDSTTSDSDIEDKATTQQYNTQSRSKGHSSYHQASTKAVAPPPPPPSAPAKPANRSKDTRRNPRKVRRVQPLPRDENGRYIVPVTVGILTVVSLGRVEYKNTTFHNERYIWPIGYTVKRYYNSTVDPNKETCYTATITEVNNLPRFIITAEDCPTPFEADSPTGVWTMVMRLANKIRDKPSANSASGPDYYGFSHPTIAKMVQDLENADKCKRYRWQEFELMDPRYVPTRKWNTPPAHKDDLKIHSTIANKDYKPVIPSKLAVESTNKVLNAEEADRLLSQSEGEDEAPDNENDDGKGGNDQDSEPLSSLSS